MNRATFTSSVKRDKQLPRVLCVDDEAEVLEGLTLHLDRRYLVIHATSGPAGLEVMRQEPDLAVVISDMRMPGMDGAAFLAHARERLPHAIRILLTGLADVQAAIHAVNDGQIFRFLTKPCPPATLLAAVDAATEQHRLVTAERVLLEQTLHGSIKALIDVLAIVNPTAFGRASRIKRAVSELATKLGITERWQLEVAAMLHQLGSITLPAVTVEKLYYGRVLTEAERAMCARIPTITEQLLGSIPRLETVREILATYPKPFRLSADPAKRTVRRLAQVLRVAIDYDALEVVGNPPSFVVDTLRGRKDTYDPEVLDTMIALRAAIAGGDDVRELPLASLRPGMVFAADVTLATGTLLVARGCEVTAGFIERAKNFPVGTVQDRVRVIVRKELP